MGLEGESSYVWPIDLWLTEAVTFNALYQTSHFVISITLMLVIFLLAFYGLKNNKLGSAVWAGLTAAFFFNFHPYYMPVIYGVIGLYIAYLTWQARRIRWRHAAWYGVLLGLSLPSALYHVWLIGINPVISQRAMQNVTTISPFLFVLIGYGFLWPGFMAGVASRFQQRAVGDKTVLLLLWFVVNIALIYSPFQFHSRYTQGLQIILSIFTVAWFFSLHAWLKKKISQKWYGIMVANPILWSIVFVLIFAMSNVYSVVRDVYYFAEQPGVTKQLFYLDNDLLGAYEYLDQLPKDKLVLAADISSKFTPGFTGQTVYAAHAHETIYFSAKEPRVFWFFGSNDDTHDQAKHNFLLDTGITHVLFSDYERMIGDFNPEEKTFLQKVYEQNEVKLYQVIR
jgi:hypothetical protein